MATYLNNKYNGTVIIHTLVSNTIVVAGASGVSNLVANSSEVVIDANIQRIWWGSTNASFWTVGRVGQANLFNLDSSGYMDFRDGAAISQGAAANLVLTFTGTGAGFCAVEVKKHSS